MRDSRSRRTSDPSASMDIPRMQLWAAGHPDHSWGSPLNQTACHNVPAAGEGPCESAGISFKPASPSQFYRAMHSDHGVLVLAADSRVIWPSLHATFGDLLNATRWKPWDDIHSPPLLSFSFISARVPNSFCAQPTFDAMGCGAFDVVLLFRNGPGIWKHACAGALNDACGRNLCSSRGWPPLRRIPDCPGAFSSEGLQQAAALCSAPGGLREHAGRCLVRASAGGGGVGSPSRMEKAMQLFQRACRETPDDNVTFATMQTCFGRNKGQLHNELQFKVPAVGSLGIKFASALLGVAAIGVRGGNGTARRICRARRLASALQTHLPKAAAAPFPPPKPMEVWQFELDPSLTPKAPILYTAPLFRSKAHSCVGGGGEKRSDFASHDTIKRVWVRKERRWANRAHPQPPLLPHASYWGYYFEGDSWSRWSRVR